MERLMTTAELAAELDETPERIRYHTRKGHIPAAGETLGGHRRYRLEDVRRALYSDREAQLRSALTPEGFEEIPPLGSGTAIGGSEELEQFSPYYRRHFGFRAAFDEERFVHAEDATPEEVLGLFAVPGTAQLAAAV